MDSKTNLSNSKQVKCPQCGRLTLYTSQNPSRPFCSERCKLIDLGAWASEGYKIPLNNQQLTGEDEYTEIVAGEEQQE